jgi:hypothetical protein
MTKIRISFHNYFIAAAIFFLLIPLDNLGSGLRAGEMTLIVAIRRSRLSLSRVDLEYARALLNRQTSGGSPRFSVIEGGHMSVD